LFQQQQQHQHHRPFYTAEGHPYEYSAGGNSSVYGYSAGVGGSVYTSMDQYGIPTHAHPPPHGTDSRVTDEYSSAVNALPQAQDQVTKEHTQEHTKEQKGDKQLQEPSQDEKEAGECA
jgi:hypothetical protein